ERRLPSMAIHRPAAAFLDIIERKQNNLHISRITTVISDVFYTSNLFPGVRFGRRNLEDAVCQLLNERYPKEVACAYKLIIFNQKSRTGEGDAIALLKRHMKRVASDVRNKRYHILLCSNAKVTRILELRYAEEAFSLFGYRREHYKRGFALIADGNQLARSTEQMSSFAGILDSDEESVALKLDRSLSLVESEEASIDDFLNAHLPASFYTFKIPSQAQHLVETSIGNLREERKHVDRQLCNVEFPFSFIRIEMPDSARWQGVFYAEDDVGKVIEELSKASGIAPSKISLKCKLGEKLKRNSSLKKIGAIPGEYLYATCLPTSTSK
uniref:Uncharacterized protein n=2 Tax=Parascaris univalens TaxID=6257 RepID=A0A915AJU0_PARUN